MTTQDQQSRAKQSDFEDWSIRANQGYDLTKMHSGKMHTYEDDKTEHAWRGFFYGWKAARALPAGMEPLCYIRPAAATTSARSWQAWENDGTAEPVYTAAQVQAMLAQGVVTAPACPFPCGWENLHKLAVAEGAYLANNLLEGDPVTGKQRDTAMRVVLRDIETVRAMLAAAQHQAKSGAKNDQNPAQTRMDAGAQHGGGLPEGWQAVPVEPTHQMQSAALKYVVRQHQTRDVWRTMLASAPQTPAAQVLAMGRVPLDAVEAMKLGMAADDATRKHCRGTTNWAYAMTRFYETALAAAPRPPAAQDVPREALEPCERQAARTLPVGVEPFAWANVFNDPRRPSFDKLAAPHITEDAADRQIERHEQRRLTPLRKVPLYTTAPGVNIQRASSD